VREDEIVEFGWSRYVVGPDAEGQGKKAGEPHGEELEHCRFGTNIEREG